MGLLRRKRLLFGLFLLVVLPGAMALSGWLFSDRILDGVVRPHLERIAASRLQAEVQAGSLVWEKGGLTLTDLAIRRRGHYRISVPQLRVLLSLRDLLRRRLTAVDLLNPDIEISPSPSSKSDATIPPHPPFSVGRLTLRGGRLAYARSGRPLVAQDLDLSLHDGAKYMFSCSGRISAQTPIPVKIGGAGQWRDGIRMTLDTLQWQGRSLLRRPVFLSLPSGRGGGRIKFELDLGQVTRGDVQHLLTAFQASDILPHGLGFAAEKVRVSADWRPGILDARLYLGRGHADFADVRLPVVSLAVTSVLKDGRWRGRGGVVLAAGATGVFDFGGGGTVSQGKLALNVSDPVALQQSVLGRVALPVKGSVGMAAGFLRKAEGVSLSYVLQGGPGGSKAAGALVDISTLALRGMLQKRPKGWQIETRAQLAGKSLATLSGHVNKLRIDMLPTPWSRLRRLLPAGRRPAWLKDAQGLAGRMTLLRDKSGWQAETMMRADQVSASAGRARNLRFEGRISVRAAKVNLSSANVQARIIHDRFGEGRLASRFNAVLKRGGGWDVKIADLDLGPLEFMSADGLAGLAGGRVNLRGRVCRASATSPLEMLLNGRIAAAEALWGAWYGELGDLPVDFGVFVHWYPTPFRLEVVDVKLDAGGLASIQGRGESRKDYLSFAGTLKVPDLAAAWDGHGRALVRELRPAVDDLGLKGGVEARLDLSGVEGRWRVKGEVQLQNLFVDWPRIRLEGRNIQGKIPLDLECPANSPAKTQVKRGRLVFDDFLLGPLRSDEDALQLAVETNRISVENALRLSLGGGLISAEGLRGGYDPGGLRFETRIRLAGIDLEFLASELGMVPMEGEINADLGHIRYVDGVLRSDGQVQIEAFGGEMRLRNLQLDPLSLRLPQFQTDLEFSGIDLYQLTRTFSFGAINGVVDGEVHGLRLYGATPSHFSGWLKTRLKGRRNISVKALNNLSILSQGGLSAALSRGIYRFIDFYRYRRIGMSCNLAEDVFTLVGTARPDSRRYLVDGGLLPPKIDIVAPQRPISFREMLRRLKRLDRAGRGAD